MGIENCRDLYDKRGYIKILMPAYEAELCMRNVLGVLTDPYTGEYNAVLSTFSSTLRALVREYARQAHSSSLPSCIPIPVVH